MAIKILPLHNISITVSEVNRTSREDVIDVINTNDALWQDVTVSSMSIEPHDGYHRCNLCRGCHLRQWRLMTGCHRCHHVNSASWQDVTDVIHINSTRVTGITQLLWGSLWHHGVDSKPNWANRHPWCPKERIQSFECWAVARASQHCPELPVSAAACLSTSDLWQKHHQRRTKRYHAGSSSAPSPAIQFNMKRSELCTISVRLSLASMATHFRTLKFSHSSEATFQLPTFIEAEEQNLTKSKPQVLEWDRQSTAIKRLVSFVFYPKE